MNTEIITQLIFAHLWQGLLFVPVVWVITRYFIKEDAALRHGLWFATLCLLAVLPFTTFIDLPRLTTQWFQMDKTIEIVRDVSFSQAPDTFVFNIEQKDTAHSKLCPLKLPIIFFSTPFY